MRMTAPPLSALVTILSLQQHIGQCVFDEVNVRNDCALGPKDSLLLLCPIAKDFGDQDISVSVEYGTNSFVTQRTNGTWTPDSGLHCGEKFCTHYVDAKCVPHNQDAFCYTNLVRGDIQDDYLLSLGMMMNIKDTSEKQAEREHFHGAFKCSSNRVPLNEVQMFLFREDELLKKLSISPLLDELNGPWFYTSLNDEDMNSIKDGEIFLGCLGKVSPQNSTIVTFAKVVEDSESGLLRTVPNENRIWRSAIENYISTSLTKRIF